MKHHKKTQRHGKRTLASWHKHINSTIVGSHFKMGSLLGKDEDEKMRRGGGAGNKSDLALVVAGFIQTGHVSHNYQTPWGRGEGRTGVKGAGRGVGEEGGGVTVSEVSPPCKKNLSPPCCWPAHVCRKVWHCGLFSFFFLNKVLSPVVWKCARHHCSQVGGEREKKSLQQNWNQNVANLLTHPKRPLWHEEKICF